ncbi:hypothetical protein AD006_31350 (plasmid) [Pseudonocardia sp. EC080610-09]|nr:hypothetical protein AD006_31350 [Pseudonocardia sp. EC080610-09]ALL85375.1 hypothetical protein AD017_29890 [Pseudonocardia sp. EC080619-01]
MLTAYRLALSGAEVTLVDAGDLGAGTSGGSFAHANASYAGYWDYVELRRDGVAGYRRLRAELGGAPWLHDTGCLSVHLSEQHEAEFDAHLRRLDDLGHAAERVEGPVTALEPALDVDQVGAAGVFPDEGYVDVPVMLEDLAARLRALGVVVRTGDAVAGVEIDNGQVREVRLRSGTSLPADWLVSCVGRWTDELVALAGVAPTLVAHEPVGGVPVPGLLVVVPAGPTPVSRVVAVDDMNYRPAGEGRTMVWSGSVDMELAREGGASADPATIERLVARVVEAAAEHAATLRGATPLSAIVCQRALPADGLPVVGAVPGLNGLYVVLAHAAITMAPALADIVTLELTGGRTDPRVTRFRPDRLLAKSVADSDQQLEGAS